MKRSNHKISSTIDATPAQAWEIIGAVSGVNNWLAPITDCRIEGDKRICTTEQGSFEEDIIKVDHDNQIFQYGIPTQNMIPVSDIKGEMKVLENNGKATIEWSWNYDVEASDEDEAKEHLTIIGNMGIQGIESLIKRTVVA
ncbi:MAG: SRPBCC family protein [Cyclobacteriaceae bacterium]